MTNRAALRRMNDTATVWPKGESDDYGYPTWGLPYTILCNYVDGGDLTKDPKGDEFVPMATIRTLDTTPQRDDMIVRGDFTANTSPDGTGAQRIRVRKTVTAFRNIQQSIVLKTDG